MLLKLPHNFSSLESGQSFLKSQKRDIDMHSPLSQVNSDGPHAARKEI